MPGVKRAIIDPEKCDRSPTCPPMLHCPAQAIVDEDGVKIVTNDCRGCKKCVLLCPNKAISMV
ncbi:4Fe-4S binding protein [Calderihabitans maritimus]|uniref:4Fe-4S ferredoxin, partial n=1 Tax=Calderihabitans maritimus TaxID=1246530 RepID=A0A1Z5HUQ0_9FIRM|nr:4Fe-4S binding protein [Calderihabitans maritimus]GAW93055.1 4Fe-4S ferredoxin [Calderihabitans maritimus]